MSGREEPPATAPGTKTPARSSALVTLSAWLVALVLVSALAFAVTDRLGEAGAALRDVIARSRTTTSVAYESQAIAPPDEEDAAVDQKPATRDAEGDLVTPPRWISVPSPDYPLTDGGDMVAGTVSLSCRVTSAGRLDGCQILDEAPPGRGFGDAALEAVSIARLAPRQVDGVATEGRVQFTIRFTPQGNLTR